MGPPGLLGGSFAFTPTKEDIVADRFRGPRMSKNWSGIPGFTNAFTANATVGTGGSTPGAAATVIRMLGEYVITPTPGGAVSAGDAVDIGVGIAVVSSDAFTAGVLPDPLGEPGYPWLYWTHHPFFLFDGTLAEGLSLANGRFTFDIRSKRRMKAQETLVLIVEYGDVNGAPPMTYCGGQVRVLFAGL